MQYHDTVYVTKSLSMNKKPGGAIIGVRGAWLGAIIPMQDGDVIVVGRDTADSELVIRKSTVSRKHCTIRYHGDKRMYSVWDWSKNGTFRSNGQRLEQGFEYRFLAGEELIIGDEENVLKLG